MSEADDLEAWLERRDRRANLLALGALSLTVLVPVAALDRGGAWVGSAFLAAMLLHELGHRLASRHRGLRLHLATLFGGRLPAHAPAAGAFRRHGGSSLVGLLAGALILLVHPGLVFEGLDWLEWLGIALVAISYLSLLPLPVCDGGQLLDRAFFPHRPMRAWTLQLTAVVVLTLGGIAFITIPLAVLVAPAVVMMVHCHRVARLRARVLDLGLSAPATPAAALEAVSAAGLRGLPFPRRRRLAAALLAGVGEPPPSAPAGLALGVLYMSVLVATPLLMSGV